MSLRLPAADWNRRRTREILLGLIRFLGRAYILVSLLAFAFASSADAQSWVGAPNTLRTGINYNYSQSDRGLTADSEDDFEGYFVTH